MGLFDFLFKPSVPAAPPPPPPPEPIDTRDEISGTETVYVTGPDGKKTAVTRRLPLTPEQQQAQDTLDRFMKENLARIEVLSGPDYAQAIPGLADTLKAFSDYNTGLVDKTYAKLNTQSNRDLSRRGLSDSTTAVQAGMGLKRAEGQDRIAIGQQAKLMEGDIRDAEIGRAQNLYGIASSRGDANYARAADGLSRQQGTSGILLNTAQNYNNMLNSNNQNRAALQYQASQAGLSNIGGMIGLGMYGFDKLGGFKKLGWN